MAEGESGNANRRVDGRVLRYQHRRAELLDDLLAYMLDNGIGGMSMRNLAEAVGISHVTLRHHFGTREQLLTEVFAVIARREPIPSDVVSGGLRNVLTDLWRRWSSNDGQRYFRLVFEVYGLAIRNPDLYRAFLDGIVSGWIVLISQSAAQSGYPLAQADRLATRILSQIRGLQMDLLATGDLERITSTFDDFTRQLAVEVVDRRQEK